MPKRKGINRLMPGVSENQIASAKEGFILSGIVRDFKKYTSSTIIKAISIAFIRAEKTGCYGFLKKLEKRTVTTKIFNSPILSVQAGVKTTILKN